MQSFSTTSADVEVFVEPLKMSTEVQHLELLLNKIFGDEIEKIDGVDHASNLIEFPLKEEANANLKVETEVDVQVDVQLAKSHAVMTEFDLFDFSPGQSNDIFKSSSSTPILKSIIEEDEVDSRLQVVVEAQQRELSQLRQKLKDRDYDIRALDLQIAANADQLKYMPELFNKALLATELKNQLNELQEALEAEQLTHEQSRDLLFKTQARVDRMKNTFWFKLGRSLGFTPE